MKVAADRTYTIEFRDAAVKQVIDGGRAISAVARSLEISSKTLANWVYRARKGHALVRRLPTKPVVEMEAELSRLRQENARHRNVRAKMRNWSSTYEWAIASTGGATGADA